MDTAMQTTTQGTAIDGEQTTAAVDAEQTATIVDAEATAMVVVVDETATTVDAGATATATVVEQAETAADAGALALIADDGPAALAIPEGRVTIRPGRMDDIPFMDSLQKLHTRQVGWMPTKQFEGKIAAGHVLIAEEASGWQLAAGGSEKDTEATHSSSSEPLAASRQPPARLGYLIGNDQYFKRDDVGIIYQMNVLPGRQRGLIGASLLKAQFDRSAWGCKLYCCWCAQDIAANHFWEAMGFVPLAFRTGSATKGKGGTGRMHIFWQKRIRAGDTGDISQGGTPWWFPSQTSGGSIREDRIVLPIPPGTHWSDAKPIVLPGMNLASDTPALPAPRAKRVKAKPKIAAPVRPPEVSSGGFWFPSPTPAVTAIAKAAIAKAEATPVAKIEATSPGEETPKVRRAKQKNDPRLIAAARELRDRWLEQVNHRNPNATPLIGREKYAVSRSLHGPGVTSSLTSVQVMTVRAMHEVRCLPPDQMAA